jgi:hypothetical protein
MLEHMHEMLRARPSFIPISGVECRLAATCLIFKEFDVVPNSTQHLDRIHCHFGQQLVDKARHEE